MLQIKNLEVKIKDRIIVGRCSLTIPAGELHAFMGPNGSGKTSLAFALAGHPHYTVSKGTVKMDGKNLLSMTANERAKAGLFLSFQQPPFFEGIAVAHFLRAATNEVKGTHVDALAFRSFLNKKMEALSIDTAFRSRPLNHGFSGGEKKQMEMLQLLCLEPRYAILDEADSGLDIDAIKMIAKVLRQQIKDRSMGVLMISHNPSLFQLIRPDVVHIMLEGSIARSGGPDLLEFVQAHGYGKF